MAYVYPNFKTKKELNEAIKNGLKVTARNNTPRGQESIETGSACIEGPHYPKPHKWYATVVVENEGAEMEAFTG